MTTVHGRSETAIQGSGRAPHPLQSLCDGRSRVLLGGEYGYVLMPVEGADLGSGCPSAGVVGPTTWTRFVNFGDAVAHSEASLTCEAARTYLSRNSAPAHESGE